MNTFSKKSLHVALAALGAWGLSGTASAVMVNPNGLGQVLVYPYYTVRSIAAGPYNTVLSVVNTTGSTKAVKVRFREGAASKEVLDFNVFLSPHDVWTAAVTPSGANGATISTDDHSCTIPTLRGNPQEFRTFDSDADVIGTSRAGRVTEGYFEIFEMATYAPDDPVAINSTHSGPNGFPADCSAVTDAAAAVNPLEPTGGLSGEAAVINVNAGDLFGEDATALTQFWTTGTGTGSYSTTGDDTPNFTNSTTVASAVDNAGRIVTGAFSTGELAATAALQRTSVINEFNLSNSTLSGTDWVITMPTKHHLVTETAVQLPFQSTLGKNGSCDDITTTLYDREEFATTPSGSDFSPSPPAGKGSQLCWEANVVSFKRPSDSTVLGANVFNSANRLDITTDKAAGWANITFRAGAVNSAGAAQIYDPTTGTLNPASGTFSGLPVIGFAAQSFVNGTLTDSAGQNARSIYGGSWGHRYVGPQVFTLPLPATAP
jgi:hypothetical protein